MIGMGRGLHLEGMATLQSSEFWKAPEDELIGMLVWLWGWKGKELCILLEEKAWKSSDRHSTSQSSQCISCLRKHELTWEVLVEQEDGHVEETHLLH